MSRVTNVTHSQFEGGYLVRLPGHFPLGAGIAVPHAFDDSFLETSDDNTFQVFPGKNNGNFVRTIDSNNTNQDAGFTDRGLRGDV